MEINSRERDNVVILDISGEVDLYYASAIVKMINKFCEDKTQNIIINLKDVTYIDSSGIGALISSLLRFKEHKKEMKIINVFAAVKKVFELTNLTSIFDIYENEEEAIKAFKI